MTTADSHTQTGDQQSLLGQESCRLSETLRRIEALCEASPRNQDLGQAQQMVSVLQRRIERLRRLDQSLQAS
jgi:hypothetical protein